MGAISASQPAIVGRDPELLAISEFLARIGSGPCGLVLEGNAGIGKTTLWLAGVAEAREHGSIVLVARAAESEARLSYAALGDLLSGVPDADFDQLPGPLRRALDGALLRGDAAGGPPDPRAVSLAVGRIVRTLASSWPVVVAIDDIQWLDRPSARVLSFVLCRLTDERIGILASLRLGSAAPGDPIDIDRAVPDTIYVAVGPLTVGALGRILHVRTNRSLPRPFVTRIHHVTDGNPLFALEIARAASGDPASADRGAAWSVPENLQNVLSARLATVPLAAQPSLLAISATTQPTWDLVLNVSGSSEPVLAGLARAEEVGIIERADGRVRFTHPLLASTVYLNATIDARRSLHLRLASILDDPEERARHLALGTDGPDAGVARSLDVAARHARTRGAPDAAAELADMAILKTLPSDDAQLRARRLAAAEYHFDAGDGPRAHQLLREMIATSPPGTERAEMLYRRASMSWMNLIDGVQSQSLQALAEAGGDADLQSGILNALTWVDFYRGDLAAAAKDARESADWALRAADPAVRSDALATLAFVEFLQGRPNLDLMADAIVLQVQSMSESSWTESAVYTTPRSIRGLTHMWSGNLAAARADFENEMNVYEQHAMYAIRQEVLCYLAELECRAGRWQLAASYADEAMEIIEDSGQAPTQRHVVLFNRAWPAALLGHVEDAREMATTGVRLAEANDDSFNAAWNHAVLGFLELSLADFEAARTHLEAAVTWLERLGSVEPGVIPCVPDLVEALVGLGRREQAERLLARLEAQAADRDRPWPSGVAARGRALVAAATGDLDEAEQAAERSIDHLARADQPFDTARSHLVLGQIRRRAKQRRRARETLEHARDAFAELGARLWVERAEAELRRLGGRSPAGDELTSTERRIAELVADGLTNREVAATLVVAERTVEGALTQIYRKLDIRSRTELVRRITSQS